jgi:hypothetical protein
MSIMNKILIILTGLLRGNIVLHKKESSKGAAHN